MCILRSVCRWAFLEVAVCFLQLMVVVEAVFLGVVILLSLGVFVLLVVVLVVFVAVAGFLVVALFLAERLGSRLMAADLFGVVGFGFRQGFLVLLKEAFAMRLLRGESLQVAAE